jgi:hypothetical protein
MIDRWKLYYRLVDRVPVVCSLLEQARFWQTGECFVDRTDIGDDVSVSTVFLGIDHSLSNIGPPILFETLVFGGKYDDDRCRYSTWDQAAAGHRAMVAKIRQAKFKVVG